jgi:hypothetical protein
MLSCLVFVDYNSCKKKIRSSFKHIKMNKLNFFLNINNIQGYQIKNSYFQFELTLQKKYLKNTF